MYGVLVFVVQVHLRVFLHACGCRSNNALMIPAQQESICFLWVVRQTHCRESISKQDAPSARDIPTSFDAPDANGVAHAPTWQFTSASVGY